MSRLSATDAAYRAHLRARWPERAQLVAIYAFCGSFVFFGLDLVFAGLLGIDAGAGRIAAVRLPWTALSVLGFAAARRAPRAAWLPAAVVAMSVGWTAGNAWAYASLGLAGSPLHAVGMCICFLTAATFMPVTFRGRAGVFLLMGGVQVVLDLSYPQATPLAFRLWTDAVIFVAAACVAVVFENFSRSQRRGFELRRELEAAVAALEASRARMSAAAAGVAASVVQLESSASVLRDRSDESTVEREAVAGASARIAHGARTMRDRARDGAATAAEAQRRAAAIGAILDRIEAGVREVDLAVSRSEGSYRALQLRADDIGTFVETARDGAAATHMLAVNAGIEAASAGEHGKGFAVIAGEVRRLANDSAGSAASVARAVDEIQRQMGGMLEALHGLRERTGELGATFGSARSALGEIRATVEALGAALQASAAEAGVQADSSTHVWERAARVGELLDGLRRAATEVAETSATLSTHASGLREVAPAPARPGR